MHRQPYTEQAMLTKTSPENRNESFLLKYLPALPGSLVFTFSCFDPEDDKKHTVLGFQNPHYFTQYVAFITMFLFHSLSNKPWLNKEQIMWFNNYLIVIMKTSGKNVPHISQKKLFHAKPKTLESERGWIWRQNRENGDTLINVQRHISKNFTKCSVNPPSISFCKSCK